MRNPNGYGTVYKLGGNRRRPYVAKKTVGYNDKGQQLCEVIGYYPTRTEAMLALADFNSNPYDVQLANSSFSEVYEMLKEQRFPKMSKSLKAQHEASYKKCSSLYDIKYTNLRQLHFQRIIDECTKSQSTQTCIKNLFVTMDKFAYDMEIIDKMRSANLTVRQTDTKIQRKLFTKEEIQTLWQHQSEFCIDETLVMLYTGMRISEMLMLRCKDIDINQNTLKGGLKTAAGKNRIIPIHSKLRPVIERHLSNNEYLFSYTNEHGADNVADAFRKHWESKLAELGMKHYTHDCRHTFRTAIDGQNTVCVNLIMGHKTGDIGERVYTHKTIEELKAVIDCLDY